MQARFDGIRHLATRYREAFQRAWDNRALLDPPTRSRDELAFLPAELELVETPVGPCPLLSMRTIVMLAGLAFAWSVFGHFDIVAIAGGKTVHSGRTKVVQAAEKAVVAAIHVRDGQRVDAGQLLLELNDVDADADHRSATETLRSARLAAARQQALLDALQNGAAPKIAAMEGADSARVLAETQLALSQWQAHQARQQAQEAAVRQREAELATIRETVRKLEHATRLAAARAQDYQALFDQNFVSRHAYQEKQQQHLETASDLAAQKSRLRETQAALVNQQQALRANQAAFGSEALDALRQARQTIQQTQEALRKTELRRRRSQLVAPVAGTVQQLAVHTVGGVVTDAQALLAVVPGDDTLEVEARIENKDIGFVRTGQRVTVKIDSFPYTRYGFIEGTVDSVSTDAVADETLGWVFPARIRLQRDRLLVEGVPVKLTPGMTVNAEIKTGKRRIISYFLDPLQTTVERSLSER